MYAEKLLVDQNLPEISSEKNQQVLADFQVEISAHVPQRSIASVKHNGMYTQTYSCLKSKY